MKNTGLALLLVLAAGLFAHADTPPARSVNSQTFDGVGNSIGSTSGALNVFSTNTPASPTIASPYYDSIVVGGAVIDPRQVTVGSSVLPTGASTSSLQTTMSGQLTTLSGQLPTTIGQKPDNASLSVVISSGQSTGLAVNSLQTAGNNLLTTGNGLLTQIANNTASALNDITSTGTITAQCTTPASCAAGSFVSVASQGQYTIGLSITGTFVGAYLTEGQNVDGTWTTLPMFISQSGVIPFPSSNALAGAAQVLVIGGAYQNIRVRSYTFTSGTINVALDASIAQQAVFAAQMGTWTFSGVYNATPPVVTSGQPVTLQTDNVGRMLVQSAPTDGTRATYSASIAGLVSVAAPTDLFTISGAAGKVIRIQRIMLTASQTTSAQRDVIIVKRSTLDTAGTSTTLTGVPYDSSNPAATAVVKAYTANPTALGTSVGNLRTRKVFIGTTAANSDEFIIDFSGRSVQPWVLRGATENLAINLNGVASPGSSFDISIEWTEDTL